MKRILIAISSLLLLSNFALTCFADDEDTEATTDISIIIEATNGVNDNTSDNKNDNKKPDKVDTNVRVKTCAEEMGSDSWVWDNDKGKCIYRVINTSAKQVSIAQAI